MSLNGNILFWVVLLKFVPADGRVCKVTCPTLPRCTHVLFGVHVHVNSVWNSTYTRFFGSEMHIRSSNIFPGCITSLLRMCSMEIFFIRYFMIFFITVTSELSLFTKIAYGGHRRSILFIFLTLSHCKFAPLIQYTCLWPQGADTLIFLHT